MNLTPVITIEMPHGPNPTCIDPESPVFDMELWRGYEYLREIAVGVTDDGAFQFGDFAAAEAAAEEMAGGGVVVTLRVRAISDERAVDIHGGGDSGHFIALAMIAGAAPYPGKMDVGFGTLERAWAWAATVQP